LTGVSTVNWRLRLTNSAGQSVTWTATNVTGSEHSYEGVLFQEGSELRGLAIEPCCSVPVYSQAGVQLSGTMTVYYEIQLDEGESWNGNYMEVEHITNAVNK
jgi:hypothetical protein